MEQPRVIREEDLERIYGESDLLRKRILTTENIAWFRIMADGCETGDWHTHRDMNSYLYVLSGNVSIQFGADDTEPVEVVNGDFLFIPAGRVYRHVVDEGLRFEAINLLVGSGEPYSPVDDPDRQDGTGAVNVIRSDSVEEAESTPGVIRKSVFKNDDVHVIKGDVEGGNVSSWHRHPARQVCSYNISGDATIEFEEESYHTLRPETGDYIYIPASLIHRASAETGGQEAIAYFVGDGPLVENME